MAELEALVEAFVQTGIAEIPDVLSPEQIERARAALAHDRAVRPDSWNTYGRSRDGGPVGESGRWQQHTLLSDSTDFDWVFRALLEHPLIVPFARRVVGPEACLSNLFCRVRDPVPDPPPPPEMRVEGSTGEPGVHWRMWHRESGGRCLPHHPFFIHTLQLALELDDNTPEGHCLSIVPESLEAKKVLPWEERGEDAAGPVYQLTEPFIEKMWRNNNRLPEGRDVLCKAGTVVLWNNSNIHAGTVRQTLGTRRTLGMHWYSELPAMLASTGSTTSNESREIRQRGIGRFVGEFPASDHPTLASMLRWLPILDAAEAEADAAKL